jgi:hypothetical protein
MGILLSDAGGHSYMPGTKLSAGRDVLAVAYRADHLRPEQPKGVLLGPWSRPFWITVALLAFSPVSLVRGFTS